MNDDLLKKVLKNRLGWNISEEDGTPRNYVFSISDKMIIQGIKSSGLGFRTSHFKPMVAKWIYNKYAKKRVLDFSSGWGARMLAACSLNLDYIGIDPLTADKLNEMKSFFNLNVKIIKGQAENKNIYDHIGKFDFIFSCPPYFDKEIYSIEDSQCYNQYKNYDFWINGWWFNVVKNCLSVLDENGIFGFIVIDKLKNDMLQSCFSLGLKLVDEIFINTITSHLSKKVKTKKTSKQNESLLILKKLN